MAAEDRKAEATELEGLYKTKAVQFFGRSVPIILQNDNGPCPLIAICNVLLLRNNISLTLEASEISLKKLLSLVAERLLDSNSNVQDKDAGFVRNQQQNIHDAIEMLPRLATGIDVNLHFSRIDDFEFTPERSIFDLLGIELYHGWIVDPQDVDTLKAIGSKSYNTLMAEIVSLEETRDAKGHNASVPEDDSVDFAAATTATLGVPFPSLARARSFDESPIMSNNDQKLRKGDREEEEELLRVLQLSKADLSSSPNEAQNSVLVLSSGLSPDSLEETNSNEYERTLMVESVKCDDQLCTETEAKETKVSLTEFMAEEGSNLDHVNSEDCFISSGSSEANMNVRVTNDPAFLAQETKSSSMESKCEDRLDGFIGDQLGQEATLGVEPTASSVIQTSGEDETGQMDKKVCVLPNPVPPNSNSPDGGSMHLDISENDIGANLENTEPIYEGEDCILDRRQVYENREPMYEGEMVLAEQAGRASESDSSVYPKSEDAQKESKGKHSLSAKEGELIRNFLKSNASQLTIYGLFCLQDGLKERELCVFFRNNHFNTMFKFNGELYLLATDQGYINQPDLVWEKLNEVNGDTVFMTGNFTEFNPDSQVHTQWDEQNAVATTADYLATIDKSAVESSTLSSDLQLAIALQQQEFEQQQQQQQQQHPQHQNPQPVQKSSFAGASRLITGPQGPKGGSSYSKPEGKSKDKERCTVM